MAHKKIREYDSKRLLNEHFKRLSGCELPIKFAQIAESTNLNDLANNEPWLSSSKLVVKPNMLFGKRGKSSFALNLDYAQVATFVKEQLGKEHQMEGERGTQIQTQSATSGSSAAEAVNEENIMEQFLGTRRGHKTN